VPVEYILAVEVMTEEEKKQKKNLIKNQADIGFKIVFYKKKLIKGAMQEPKEEEH